MEENRAVRHFIGNDAEKTDLRKFDQLYDIETMKYLIHSTPRSSSNIRYVFTHALVNKSASEAFRLQCQQLQCLKNSLGKEIRAYFIAREPANTETYHFIFGIIINRDLWIVNPIGETKHYDFYSILNAMQEKDQSIDTIYLSITKIQKDPNARLVSCGPICVEILLHMASLSAESLLSLHKEKCERYGLTYFSVDITSLLPVSLQTLLVLEEEHYQKEMIAIREQHLKVLRELPVCERGTLSSQNAFLEQCLNADEQVLIEKLLRKEKFSLEKLMQEEAYIRLEEALSERLVLIPRTNEHFENKKNDYLEPENKIIGRLMLTSAKESSGRLSILENIKQALAYVKKYPLTTYGWRYQNQRKANTKISDDFNEHTPFLENQFFLAAKKGDLHKLKDFDLTRININVHHTKNGNTALHFAIQSGSKIAVDWLLAHGASINEVNNDGQNAIVFAESIEQYEILFLLEQKQVQHISSLEEKFTTLDNKIPEAMQEALKSTNDAFETDDKNEDVIFGYIIKVPSPHKLLDLIKEKNSVDIIKQCLSELDDPFLYFDGYGRNALHLSVPKKRGQALYSKSGEAELTLFLCVLNEAVRYKKVNKTDNDGRTVLHLVAMLGDPNLY